jgi:hypothetical protein
MPLFDYSDAPPPQFDLIPQDTVATVSTHIRPGGAGEDGLLKRSKDGSCEMLDFEFTILDGTYKGRRFWTYLVLTGTTEGQAKAADSSRGTLKAILDSALGLKPNDVSAEARAARTVSLGKFNGMAFIAKIGIERGGPKSDGTGTFWPDKNVLGGVVTPDKTGWHAVEQPPPFVDGGSAPSSGTPPTPAAPVERPGWAV